MEIAQTLSYMTVSTYKINPEGTSNKTSNNLQSTSDRMIILDRAVNRLRFGHSEIIGLTEACRLHFLLKASSIDNMHFLAMSVL